MTKKATAVPTEAEIAAQAAGNFGASLVRNSESRETEAQEQRQAMVAGAVAHSQYLQAHPDQSKGTFRFPDGSTITRN